MLSLSVLCIVLWTEKYLTYLNSIFHTKYEMDKQTRQKFPKLKEMLRSLRKLCTLQDIQNSPVSLKGRQKREIPLAITWQWHWQISVLYIQATFINLYGRHSCKNVCLCAFVGCSWRACVRSKVKVGTCQSSLGGGASGTLHHQCSSSFYIMLRLCSRQCSAPGNVSNDCTGYIAENVVVPLVCFING